MIHSSTRVLVLLLCAVVGLADRVPGQRLVVATRDLTIDGGKENLSQIRGMASSPTGTVVLVQPMDHQLVFFDARGKRLGTFGRKGEGPGEFGSMQTEVGWSNDTLWVYDRGPRRTTLVGPARTMLRAIPGPIALLAPSRSESGQARLGGTVARGRFANGDMLVQTLVESGSVYPSWLPAAYQRKGALIARTSETGVLRRPIAIIPRPPASCRVEVAGGVIGIRFCASPEFDIARDGSRVLILIPAANGVGSYRIVSIDGASGDTVVNRTYRFTPRPIPRSVTEAIRSANDDPVLPPALRNAYRTAKYPSFYPPFSGLLLGVDKTMWLREYGDEGSPQRWQVLDPRGEPLGTVEMPKGISLQEASLTTLWGIELNEDDVQSAVRLRVPPLTTRK